MNDTGMNGMELKYELDSSLSREKINSEIQKAPPVCVLLNRNNIQIAEDALLDGTVLVNHV